MKDLFTPLTRDERQEESLKAWLRNKGRGCVEGCTGEFRIIYSQMRKSIKIIDIFLYRLNLLVTLYI